MIIQEIGQEVTNVTDQGKAKIILDELDKIVNINWNREEHYLNAICSGLRKGAEVESRGESKCL